MIALFVLFLFAKSSLALVSYNFQNHTNESGRLVGGTATTTLYHHHVSINVKDTAGTAFQYCSGELLSTSIIITSASCVIRGTTLTAVIGSTDGADTTAANIYTISEVITHPKFERNTKKYDIALLRIASSVTLSARNHDTGSITTIPLPSTSIGYKDNKDFELKSYRVIGFGLSAESTAWATTVSRAYADMTVLSAGDCLTAMKSSEFRLDAGILSCFSTTNTGGSRVGACKGDLGGGVIDSRASNVLVGIVTDYRRCGETTLFTRIGPVLSWIKQYVNQI